MSLCQELWYGVKGLVTLLQWIHMRNMITLTLLVQKLWPKLKGFFLSRSWSRSLGQKCTWNINALPVLVNELIWLTNIKEGQTSRSRLRGQNYGIVWKVLSQGIHMWSMKAVSLRGGSRTSNAEGVLVSNKPEGFTEAPKGERVTPQVGVRGFPPEICIKILHSESILSD